MRTNEEKRKAYYKQRYLDNKEAMQAELLKKMKKINKKKVLKI